MQIPIDLWLLIEIDAISLIAISILFVCTLELCKSHVLESEILLQISAMFLCIVDIIVTIATIQWAEMFFYIQGLLLLALMLVPSVYCMFVNEELGFHIGSNWIKACIYLAPPVIAMLLYYSLPLYTSIENETFYDHIIYKIVANASYIIPMIYESIALITTIFACCSYRKKDKEKYETATIFIVFSFIVIAIYAIQLILFDSDHSTACLAYAMGLIYLILNINNRKLKKAIQVEADLEIAKRIQMEALPKQFPPYDNHPEVELYAYMDPEKEVGGDFFDCMAMDEDRVAFLVADVSGKGIPAALYMMRAKTAIRDCMISCSAADDIMTMVNAVLTKTHTRAMFVTVWLGIYNTRTRELEYTNAGHCKPFMSDGTGVYYKLSEKHGPALGVKENAIYSKSTIKFDTGSSIFLYTDGLTEAHDINGNMYGDKNIKQILTEMNGESGKKIIDALDANVRTFSAGVEQFDDITQMMVRIIDVKEENNKNA